MIQYSAASASEQRIRVLINYIRRTVTIIINKNNGLICKYTTKTF